MTTTITVEEYAVWKARHAAAFGMHWPEDDLVFEVWRPSFEACGFTLGELTRATGAIAAIAAPLKSRQEHLAAINAAVSAERRAAVAAESARTANYRDPAEVGGPPGVCSDCGDTGTAVVPHPRYAAGGTWLPSPMGYLATAAVLCHCYRGIRVADAYERLKPDAKATVPPMMRWSRYIAVVPNWRAILADAEYAYALTCEAVSKTAGIDRTETARPHGRGLGMLPTAGVADAAKEATA